MKNNNNTLGYSRGESEDGGEGGERGDMELSALLEEGGGCWWCVEVGADVAAAAPAPAVDDVTDDDVGAGGGATKFTRMASNFCSTREPTP